MAPTAPAGAHGRLLAPAGGAVGAAGAGPPLSAPVAGGGGVRGRVGTGWRRGACPLSLSPHRTVRLPRSVHSPRGAPPAQPSPRCHRRPSPAAAAALLLRPHGGLPQARPADPAGPEGYGQPAPHQLHQSHDRGRLRVSEAGGLRPSPGPRAGPAIRPRATRRPPLPGPPSVRSAGWRWEGQPRAPSARYPLPGDTPVPPQGRSGPATPRCPRNTGHAEGPSVPPAAGPPRGGKCAAPGTGRDVTAGVTAKSSVSGPPRARRGLRAKPLCCGGAPPGNGGGE